MLKLVIYKSINYKKLLTDFFSDWPSSAPIAPPSPTFPSATGRLLQQQEEGQSQQSTSPPLPRRRKEEEGTTLDSTDRFARNIKTLFYFADLSILNHDQITERTLAGGGDGRWTESPDYADATGREVHSPEPETLTLPTISEPIPLEEGWVRRTNNNRNGTVANCI